MLASTLLMSAAPKPVTVLLCFGLVNSGPTGPFNSEMGALVDAFLSRVLVAIVTDGLKHAAICKSALDLRLKY